MALSNTPMRMLRGTIVAGVVVGLVAACAPTIARRGDLVRVTPERGERIQGSLVETRRDSIAVSDAGGIVSFARDSIERLELDRRVRSRWVRFWECANTALYAGSAVAAIRSENAIRTTFFLAATGIGGWLCLRPHSWVRARLPDEPPPAPALPDSVSPSR